MVEKRKLETMAIKQQKAKKEISSSSKKEDKSNIRDNIDLD